MKNSYIKKDFLDKKSLEFLDILAGNKIFYIFCSVLLCVRRSVSHFKVFLDCSNSSYLYYIDLSCHSHHDIDLYALCIPPSMNFRFSF